MENIRTKMAKIAEWELNNYTTETVYITTNGKQISRSYLDLKTIGTISADIAYVYRVLDKDAKKHETKIIPVKFDVDDDKLDTHFNHDICHALLRAIATDSLTYAREIAGPVIGGLYQLVKDCASLQSSGITFTEFKNGVVIVNTTPHAISVQDMDGNVIKVPTSIVLNAKAVEVPYDTTELFVSTSFKGDRDGINTIMNIETEYSNLYPDDNYTLVIVGSIIAAHAYPGLVASMVPVPGFERVAPEQKRMRCDKFTMYPAKKVR